MSTTTLDAPPSAALNSPGITKRLAARVAGISYLAMFLLVIFANFMVRENLIVPGDAASTVANITESIGVFRLGVLAFFVIFVLDIVIAWALHVVFRDTHRDVSVVTAWFRLIYSAMLGVALVSFVEVLQLLGGSGFLGQLTSGEISAQTMSAVSSFESAWFLGLGAFGVHLVLLGWLILRSGLVSRVLGWTIVTAGVAYVVDTIARIVLGDYAAVEGVMLAVVAVPSMIGEGWLGFWLLLTRRFNH